MNAVKLSGRSFLQLTASLDLDLNQLLNWIWIGFIAAAIIFLIVVIIMTIRELARSNKQAKALSHDFEPVILSLQTGVKRGERNLAAVQENVNKAQRDIEASMELVTTDVDHIRDVAALSLESTKQIAGDTALVGGQATALLADLGDSARSIRAILPEKKRDKAVVKQAKVVSKHTKRPHINLHVDVDKKPETIARAISIYRKQKRKLKQAKKTVQKQTKRMRRGGESLLRSGRKTVRVGQKRVNWLRKKFKRGQKRVRRFKQNYI